MRAWIIAAVAATTAAAGCADRDDVVVTIDAPPTLRTGEGVLVTVTDAIGSSIEETYALHDFPQRLTISARERVGPLTVEAEVFDFVADPTPPGPTEDLTEPREPLRVVLGAGATEVTLGGTAELFLAPTDFGVNQSVAGEQRLGAELFAGRQLAVAEDGTFLIVWDVLNGFRARLFGADAMPLPNAIELTSHEFDVNEPDELAGYASVAHSAFGFLAVWEHRSELFAPTELRLQLFATTDASAEAPVSLSVPPAGEIERLPALAALDGGGFAVAWLRVPEGEVDSAESFGDVRVRVVDAGGRPVGESVAVSEAGAGAAQAPDVAAVSGGGFASVWAQEVDVGGSFEMAVRGQIFDDQGAARTEVRALTTERSADYAQPHAAAVPGSSRLAVTWLAADGDTDYVALQLFEQGDLSSSGPVLRVADVGAPPVNVVSCDIAVRASDGLIAVVWSDSPAGDDDYDVFARFYAADGSPVGKVQVVNNVVTGQQTNPTIEAHGDDAFLVAWTDSSTAPPDVDALGVRARLIYPESAP